ncbi:MAG: glycerol-3-phosphate dehydrogenase [Blastocatellia bacterium]|nr:glycerol-3-phosphate dehydrogenase [Blastocatellia bacterium]
MNLSWQTRAQSIAQMKAETFDILIIGGGITGAGLALDAAARGLKTALIEKRDFAAGTSSRSTKLIHGGLRYLEHYDFALVREGLRERTELLTLAPHLDDPLEFVIPIYADKRRNYDHPLLVRAGLFLYDLLAGKYNIGRHRRISQAEALQLAPQLDPRGLKGALVYYDGRTNDSRLVIEIIKTANERGAAIANYVRLVSFRKDVNGKVCGAQVTDELTRESFNVNARAVINATGVWMNEVRSLSADLSDDDKQLRPSKGIHLTVSAERLNVTTAWLIPAIGEKRFYFVVPWEGRVNIGTTDTDYHGDKDAPGAVQSEVTNILQAVNAYFPSAHLEPSDVISAWAGLRPLISSGNTKQATTAVSRKEEIFTDRDGLISLAGGKLTTYRLMAERGIDLAVEQLRDHFGVQAKPVSTKQIILSGGGIKRVDLEAHAHKIARAENVSIETARHLLHNYGTNAEHILALTHEDEALKQPLLADLPNIAAEVIYAVRAESALTIADVLTRRTRIAMLGAAMNCVEKVADLMARELGWSEEKKAQQIAAFRAEYEREYLIAR